MARARIGLAPGLRKFDAARRRVLMALECVEQDAHRCSLHVTAHAINRAKNAAGWEMAGDLERAAEALRIPSPEYEPWEKAPPRTRSPVGQHKLTSYRLARREHAYYLFDPERRGDDSLTWPEIGARLGISHGRARALAWDYLVDECRCSWGEAKYRLKHGGEPEGFEAQTKRMQKEKGDDAE